jgi:hypothetical protein
VANIYSSGSIGWVVSEFEGVVRWMVWTGEEQKMLCEGVVNTEEEAFREIGCVIRGRLDKELQV